MTIQHIPLTKANRRMKQIREFAHSEGLVVLTSHDKPALIVLDVKRGLRLLTGMEQLMQLLMANNLVEAAQAISTADAIELSSDREWIRHAVDDLKQVTDTGTKIRSFERSPDESQRSPYRLSVRHA